MKRYVIARPTTGYATRHEAEVVLEHYGEDAPIVEIDVPVKKTLYANLYRNLKGQYSVGGVYPTVEEADIAAIDNQRVRVLEIKVVE